MRELDFLPKWYRQQRRHRRLVVAQGWATVLFGFALSTWVGVVQQNISSSRSALRSLQNQLSQSHSQVVEMAKLEERRRVWASQEAMLNKLGLHVEAARLIRALDAAMPQPVSLVSLKVDTLQQRATLAKLVEAGQPPPVERKLRVTIEGMSPSEAQLASFMTQLSSVPFFEQVSTSYVKESQESGHVLRAFEITFSVPLNAPI